jgi:hypothetical protein
MFFVFRDGSLIRTNGCLKKCQIRFCSCLSANMRKEQRMLCKRKIHKRVFINTSAQYVLRVHGVATASDPKGVEWPFSR